MFNTNITLRLLPIVCGIVFIQTACTQERYPSYSEQTSNPATTKNSSFSLFPDIIVPAGATMDVDRSLVLGGRDEWIGRLSMDVRGEPSQVYDFFISKMPVKRWQEITTVRSEISVLTYSRDERIATIQIKRKTLGGCKVDVTVSPKGGPTRSSFQRTSETPGDTERTIERAPAN